MILKNDAEWHLQCIVNTTEQPRTENCGQKLWGQQWTPTSNDLMDYQYQYLKRIHGYQWMCFTLWQPSMTDDTHIRSFKALKTSIHTIDQPINTTFLKRRHIFLNFELQIWYCQARLNGILRILQFIQYSCTNNTFNMDRLLPYIWNDSSK